MQNLRMQRGGEGDTRESASERARERARVIERHKARGRERDRLGGDEVAELAHAVLAVKHTVVEVDVQQLCPVLDLFRDSNFRL